MDKVVNFSEYHVIQDIVYDEEKRDCHFNNERKSVFDLYVPKTAKETKIDNTPVVLFVHGGGWRRGDKSAWKYYISRDINLFAAIIYFVFGLYGNVGKALARRGIACAVMSYPLTQLSTIWLLFELIVSYVSSLFVLTFLAGILSLSIYMIKWGTSNGLSVLIFPQKEDIFTIIMSLIILTNIFILIVIMFQRECHRLSLFQISVIWIGVLLVPIVLPKSYVLIAIALITFLIGQTILLNTNLNVQDLSLDDQVEAVAKCMKKIKDIGLDTKSFNPCDFYLMGHSAGGHLCSIAALCDEYVKDQGMSNVDIKGVITISPVLQLSRMNTMFVRSLYLHPTFGQTPNDWEKGCPSRNFQEQSENNSYIPPFLIVTAERDIEIIKDGAKDFHRESNKLNHGISDHVIFPRTNHLSIICNFDKNINNCNLADLCSNFIRKSLTL